MRKVFILLLIVSAGFLNSCNEKTEVVTIHTEFGDILVILFDETPEHKKNFLELAEGGFYDGTTFHRVWDEFMIQGGDPNSKDEDTTNDGTGGPGYTIVAEFDQQFTHILGALAAARQPDHMNAAKASSGSQFYIIENKDGYHSLDGEYTIFGQTISGLDVVEKIASQPVNNRKRPFTDIKITMEVTKMSKKKIAELYGYSFE
jgi:cyclophilin family peptidyl-prolyl cis-trans isomerase